MRIRVYSNLLSRSPRPFDRWFAPNLRSFNTVSKLYPAILRVSKLIHREASPVLYNSNTLTLDLTYKFGKFSKFGNVPSVNKNKWCDTASDQPLLLRKGAIYPQGLRPMRHVKIRINKYALALTMGAPVFSSAKIFSKILRCLGADSEAMEVRAVKKKTLKLDIVHQQREGRHALIGVLNGERHDGKTDMTWFKALLEDVREWRKVEAKVDLVHHGVSVGGIDVEGLGLDLG